jgi:hypothetical protein
VLPPVAVETDKDGFHYNRSPKRKHFLIHIDWNILEAIYDALSDTEL